MRMTTIRAGFRGRGLAVACAWLLAAAPAAAQGVPGCMKTEVTYRDPAPIPREAVVQVRSPRTAGTGFLIGDDLLLTSRRGEDAPGAAALRTELEQAVSLLEAELVKLEQTATD